MSSECGKKKKAKGGFIKKGTFLPIVKRQDAFYLTKSPALNLNDIQVNTDMDLFNFKKEVKRWRLKMLT
jgi:hypothetical protein